MPETTVWSKNRLCVSPGGYFRCVLLRWTTFFIFIPSGKFVTDGRCGGSTGVCGVGFATAVFCIFFGSIVSVFSPSCGTVFVAVSFPFVIGWISLETGVTSAESLGGVFASITFEGVNAAHERFHFFGMLHNIEFEQLCVITQQYLIA